MVKYDDTVIVTRYDFGDDPAHTDVYKNETHKFRVLPKETMDEAYKRYECYGRHRNMQGNRYS